MLNDPLNVILLLAAAFGAGALNAVAGGSSFLTLPALVFTGMPPAPLPCYPAMFPVLLDFEKIWRHHPACRCAIWPSSA